VVARSSRVIPTKYFKKWQPQGCHFFFNKKAIRRWLSGSFTSIELRYVLNEKSEYQMKKDYIVLNEFL
jgi:hypothetical protein